MRSSPHAVRRCASSAWRTRTARARPAPQAGARLPGAPPRGAPGPSRARCPCGARAGAGAHRAPRRAAPADRAARRGRSAGGSTTRAARASHIPSRTPRRQPRRRPRACGAPTTRCLPGRRSAPHRPGFRSATAARSCAPRRRTRPAGGSPARAVSRTGCRTGSAPHGTSASRRDRGRARRRTRRPRRAGARTGSAAARSRVRAPATSSETGSCAASRWPTRASRGARRLGGVVRRRDTHRSAVAVGAWRNPGRPRARFWSASRSGSA